MEEGQLSTVNGATVVEVVPGCYRAISGSFMAPALPVEQPLCD